MNYKKIIDPILYLILIIALLAPRLPALNSFATLDEPYWLSMGANFYYALGQHEFQNTVYEYQPAVTTMWIVTAAMMIYFPQYRGLGQGYLEFEKGALDPFLLAHGKDPLMLLYIARLLQVFLLVALFLVLYYLLRRITSRAIAFFAILFASFDPYFLGQSRLLNHEAMVSLFVIISVLAFYIYLLRGRKIIFLIFSGIMAGLAQLTKSSAIAILMPIGILLLIQIAPQWKTGFLASLWQHTKIFLVWLFSLIATYFICWPGMWVEPLKMLYVVYGNAFSYSFQGARLAVTEELEPSRFSLNLSLTGILNLIKVFLWRTSLLTWVGILLSGIFPQISPNRDEVRANHYLRTLLFSTAAAFIILFGIAQGRDSPHYILTSYLALNLLAGLGWLYVLRELFRRYPLWNARYQQAGLLLVLTAQMTSAISYYPYYFTYRNPILYAAGWYTEFPQKPYGEGLELAAHYLSGLPNARNSVALVYYARGCFSFFYSGETARFKPYYVDKGYEANLVESIQSSDYLIVYYAVQGQMQRYDSFLRALHPVTPVREIWLNGYKYVLIYKVKSIPQSVFEALSK